MKGMSFILPHRAKLMMLLVIAIPFSASAIWPELMILGIGIIAALIANSTGAGGGVLFVPVFSHFNIEAATVVGSSILIQCFGMTTGALRWRYLIIKKYKESKGLTSYLENLKICLMPCIAGAGMGVLIKNDISYQIDVLFAFLSGGFALLLLYQTLFPNQFTLLKECSSRTKKITMGAVTLIGGLITPLISIGAGELLAITLLLMGQSTRVAIGSAVSIAAFSVLLCAPFEIYHGNFDIHIVGIAVPGAMLGGFLAYKITETLGTVRLKFFFSIYALFVALIMM